MFDQHFIEKADYVLDQPLFQMKEHGSWIFLIVWSVQLLYIWTIFVVLSIIKNIKAVFRPFEAALSDRYTSDQEEWLLHEFYDQIENLIWQLTLLNQFFQDKHFVFHKHYWIFEEVFVVSQVIAVVNETQEEV